MSMSDREIWIPPVPALSDIGAYKTESPGMPGLSFLFGVAERALQRRGACATGRNHKKLRVGSPPTTDPYATPSHARLAPVPIPAFAPMSQCRDGCSRDIRTKHANLRVICIKCDLNHTLYRRSDLARPSADTSAAVSLSASGPRPCPTPSIATTSS
ncbi:hypothetical protein XavaCFBP5823_09110 [Xanthomonas axonopodis pv. vasculorum]|nr:hypothetical protein XavaCFBP5823_09110 [Xanthomonas axonopodis pv. vasculorum]